MINIRENIEPKLIELGTHNYFYNLSKNTIKEPTPYSIYTFTLYKNIKSYMLSYLYNNYKLVIIIILIIILLYIRYIDKQKKKKILNRRETYTTFDELTNNEEMKLNEFEY